MNNYSSLNYVALYSMRPVWIWASKSLTIIVGNELSAFLGHFLVFGTINRLWDICFWDIFNLCDWFSKQFFVFNFEYNDQSWYKFRWLPNIGSHCYFQINRKLWRSIPSLTPLQNQFTRVIWSKLLLLGRFKIFFFLEKFGFIRIKRMT